MSLYVCPLASQYIIVFQMEFDKTKWSCSWNSADIWLSYHLHVHIDIMLCLKGQSSQARQNCTQNPARGIKI